MKSWTYGANSYYKTAEYILEEGPWYCFFLQDIVQSICDWMPQINYIPLGDKLKKYDERFKREISLTEEFGDLQDLFHIKICEPVTKWCEKRIRETYISVDYETLKLERYNEDPEMFDEEIFKEEEK